MKKYSLILLTMTSLLLVDAPVEAAISTLRARSPQATSLNLFGKKRKRVKPRRGGLFNTGLFRKKNPCGCPKH